MREENKVERVTYSSEIAQSEPHFFGIIHHTNHVVFHHEWYTASGSNIRGRGKNGIRIITVHLFPRKEGEGGVQRADNCG
jgi:hypothetical protein